MRKAILLVEGDPYCRVLLGRFLQWEGYEVVFARDVQAATDRVQGCQGEIVLAIVNLGDETEREKLAQLKQALPDTRLLLLSTPDEEKQTFGFETLARPLYPEGLVVQVKKILRASNCNGVAPQTAC